MEDIIKKAIEGGWKLFGHALYPERSWRLINSSDGVGIEGRFGKDQWRIEVTIPPHGKLEESYCLFDLEKMFCDPLFWQALQKVKGWQSWQMEDIRTCFFGEVFRQDGNEPMGWDSAVKYLDDILSKQ